MYELDEDYFNSAYDAYERWADYADMCNEMGINPFTGERVEDE